MVAADGYNVSWVRLGEPSVVWTDGMMGGNDQQRGKRKTDRVGAWYNFAGQGLLIYSAPNETERGWNWKREKCSRPAKRSDRRTVTGRQDLLCSLHRRTRIRTRLRLGYQDDVLPGQRV